MQLPILKVFWSLYYRNGTLRGLAITRLLLCQELSSSNSNDYLFLAVLGWLT